MAYVVGVGLTYCCLFYYVYGWFTIDVDDDVSLTLTWTSTLLSVLLSTSTATLLSTLAPTSMSTLRQRQRYF